MSGDLTNDAIERGKKLGIRLVHKPVTPGKIVELVKEMQTHVDPHRRLADLPSV